MTRLGSQRHSTTHTQKQVAGTVHGITAIQLDIKLQGGVPLETLCEGIHAAARARKLILGACVWVCMCLRFGVFVWGGTHASIHHLHRSADEQDDAGAPAAAQAHGAAHGGGSLHVRPAQGHLHAGACVVYVCVCGCVSLWGSHRRFVFRSPSGPCISSTNPSNPKK